MATEQRMGRWIPVCFVANMLLQCLADTAGVGAAQGCTRPERRFNPDLAERNLSYFSASPLTRNYAYLNNQHALYSSGRMDFFGVHARKEDTMEHATSHEMVAVLYELDIGQHTLFLMSDGSLDLLTHDQHCPTRVGHGLHLDHDEAYRLCISLSAQYPTLPMKGKGETRDQGLPGQQQHKKARSCVRDRNER